MENKDVSVKKPTNKILQLVKWLVLIVLLVIAFQYIDFDEIRNTFQEFSVVSFILYLGVILISRFFYAWRWMLIGSGVLTQPKISLFYFYHANLLAEFVTIVMPSSITGEVTRVLKLNSKGNKTAASTAAILIDRAVGISSMALVSLAALLLMGQQLEINLQDLIPARFFLPFTIGVLFLLVIGGLLAWRWIRKADLRKKLERAWELFTGNIKTITYSFFISCFAHLLFSSAHYFLFRQVFSLPLVDIIGVILTPQLARSIPVSVLGISPGEGLMVASQMMVGMTRETAVTITFISLLGRYILALLGFLLELLSDGIRFFKNTSPPEEV